MRWETLFADLEAQWDAADAAELRAETGERTRYEAGRRTLVERLRAAVGAPVRFGLSAHEPLTARVSEVGPDWILVHDDGGEALLRLGAVQWVEGLARHADVADQGRVWLSLDFRRALRGLAVQRANVGVAWADNAWEQGTFDRLYADHVDLACHPAGEPRRAGAVTRVRSIPIDAVAYVRRLG